MSKSILNVRVSDKGQICLPISIRKSLEIGRGDNLVLVEIDGKILIEKSSSVADRIEDDFKDVLKFSEDSLNDVWGGDEDEIWESYL